MDKDLEIKRRLVLLLDELLEKDYWQDSSFLQVAEKQIRDMRSKIAGDNKLQMEWSQQNSPTVANEEYTKVYITLYQADGSNLAKWAQMLSAITNLSISRPIYKHEHEIQACMRAIEKKQNHAYAEVWVPNEAILSSNTPPTDKNGFELLLVREKSVKPENIVSLVHISGRYLWENGQLLHREDVDLSV